MSHPISGKRYYFSKVIYLFSFLFLLATQSFASIVINSIQQMDTSILQGATGNVLKFKLSADENITKVTIRNDSADVPFGLESIERVAILNSSFAEVGSTPGGFSQVLQVPVAIAASPGVPLSNADFYVLYQVDPKTPASEAGGSVKEASVQLESVIGSPTIAIPTSSIAYSITIEPNGLSYDQSKVLLLAPPTSVGAGFTKVSIMRFRLRANNQNVSVNTITIRSGDGGLSLPGNYLTQSDGVSEEFVKAITIYKDNGDEVWDNFIGVDPLVATKDLGTASLPLNTRFEATVTLQIPVNIPVDNTQTFYVFYDIGGNVASGTILRATLMGATGKNSTSNANVELSGALPVSADISITVADINLEQVSVTSNLPSTPLPYYGIAGERGIPVVAVTLNNKTSAALTNATFTIKNSGVTFLSNGGGVSKVLIYRNGILIGATSSFVSSSITLISGISIPTGISGFTIVYDLSVGASTLASINCQFNGVQGSSIIFGGAIPAPVQPVSFTVTAAPISVQDIVEAVTKVNSSSGFTVGIPVKHQGIFGSPIKIISVRPVFYFQNINGKDISPEYSYSMIGSPSTTLNPGQLVTYNFQVYATNLKTRGPVIVDAFVEYRDAAGIGSKPQSIVYSRYLSSGSYIAASSLTGFFVAEGGDTSPQFSLKLPAYVIGMSIVPYGLLADQAFMNGDIVPQNSKLKVFVANNGDFFDRDTLVVKMNGSTLAKGSDYDYVSGTITIADLGTSSGTITLEGYSGTAAIEKATITYGIESGFVLKDVMAGPSPYRPSKGNLYFSMQLSEEATIKILVYDSAGQLVWSKTGIDGLIGYNEYAWDGVLDVGGDIGRGVYLVYVTARNNSTDKEKVEKTKFAVF